jgi:hypothetical protein
MVESVPGDGWTIPRKQKKLQNTPLPPPLSISSSSPLLPTLSMLQKWKTLAEIIFHECNRVPPRSCVKKFHPHDMGQWSRELVGLEPQPRIKF